jgi:hypothetical protein
MNIPPLRTYTQNFIETERTNYELRENVLITSRDKNSAYCDAISMSITYNEYA